MLKNKDFCHLQDAVKTASKKVIHKADEFLGNKTPDAATKSDNDEIMKPDGNQRNVEEINVEDLNGEKIIGGFYEK